jgi:hypothetical protein
LKTKDGDSELDPEVVFKQSEKEDDSDEDEEDEFEDDGDSTPLESWSVKIKLQITSRLKTAEGLTSSQIGVVAKSTI